MVQRDHDDLVNRSQPLDEIDDSRNRRLVARLREPRHDHDDAPSSSHGVRHLGQWRLVILGLVRAPDDRRLDDRRLLALGIIAATVVGWILRVNGIGERTLFWDEAYHLALVAEPTVGRMLDAVIRNPPSDPLYA